MNSNQVQQDKDIIRLIPKRRKGLLRLVFSRVGLMIILIFIQVGIIVSLYGWLSEYFHWFAAAQVLFLLE